MKLSKGQFLYRQGEVSDSLYFITLGQVSLVSNDINGAKELARLGPGQIVGDLGYFTGVLRTSDAIAMTDVECARVSYDTVKQQFQTVPPWIEAMTKTLATQVQSYSSEIKPLRDHEDGANMSRLIVARAWAALTLVPHQYGERKGQSIYMDWSSLRMISNLCFREISARVLQLAKALEPVGYCKVHEDATGPLNVELLQPQLLSDFLTFYTRALTKNSLELSHVKPIEYATLQVLANPSLLSQVIHRGQVEISLSQFTDFARKLGHPEVTATSVDLLKAYGVEVRKVSTDSGVRLRFHQEDVTSRARFWEILKLVQEMSSPARPQMLRAQ